MVKKALFVASKWLKSKWQKNPDISTLCYNNLRITNKIHYHYRSTCVIELYSLTSIHRPSRRHLGGLCIANAITHFGYGIRRPYRHYLGHAFRSGSTSIYGSRRKCQFVEVSPHQGVGVDGLRWRDRAHLAMCGPPDQREFVRPNGLIRRRTGSPWEGKPSIW